MAEMDRRAADGANDLGCEWGLHLGRAGTVRPAPGGLLAYGLHQDQIYPTYTKLTQFCRVAGSNLIRSDHGHSLPTAAPTTLTAETFRGALAHGRAGWSQVGKPACIVDARDYLSPALWCALARHRHSSVDDVQC